jgi:hypothetical protein
MAHDIVIRGGIVDGTGSEAFSGDVDIQDGKIAKVGRIASKGKEEIGRGVEGLPRAFHVARFSRTGMVRSDLSGAFRASAKALSSLPSNPHRHGSTKIFACFSGIASVAKAPLTPASPTWPVIIGATSIRPSAIFRKVVANSSAV